MITLFKTFRLLIKPSITKTINEVIMKNKGNCRLEGTLWKTVDKLWGSMVASGYKYVVLISYRWTKWLDRHHKILADADVVRIADTYYQCRKHHRIIHVANPVFDRKKNCLFMKMMSNKICNWTYICEEVKVWLFIARFPLLISGKILKRSLAFKLVKTLAFERKFL